MAEKRVEVRLFDAERKKCLFTATVRERDGIKPIIVHFRVDTFDEDIERRRYFLHHVEDIYYEVPTCGKPQEVQPERS